MSDINSEKTTHVYYNRDVDIDEFYVRDEFANVVKSTKKVYNHALECFAGHGAIGFNILDERLVNKLSLVDIYQPAIDFCQQTIKENNIADKCTTYCSGTLNIGFADKFDLVIGNPPWRGEVTNDVDTVNHVEHQLRKKVDPGWSAHNDFYEYINSITTLDVDIFLYEDIRFTTVDTFSTLITNAGLYVENVINDFGVGKTGYVIHMKKII